jgi:hypothetical protein
LKQEISPKVLIAVIAVLVIVGVGAMIWVWRAPTAGSASVAPSNASPGRSVSDTQAMAQDRRKEMLMRKQHQGADSANGGSPDSNTGR